jgi:hypothetical protein
LVPYKPYPTSCKNRYCNRIAYQPPSLPQQQIVQPKSNPLQPVANKTSNNQTLVVKVKLEDDCWLRVVVDGKTEC